MPFKIVLVCAEKLLTRIDIEFTFVITMLENNFLKKGVTSSKTIVTLTNHNVSTVESLQSTTNKFDLIDLL